jgi:DNA-binding CsgD family transcriptional regulator
VDRGRPGAPLWDALHDPPEAEPDGDADRCYWTYRHQQPVGRYRRRTRDHGALRLSDAAPARAFRATELYNLFYRPLGIQHQLSIALKLSPTWVVVIGCNRSARDFTLRDRSLLGVLHPHVVAAYRRARWAASAELIDHALTDRELQVVAWVATGKTNAEIAQRLYLSPRTVQKHLEHVYEKLGVRTRTEAAARWHRRRALANGDKQPPRLDSPRGEGDA